MANTNEVTIKVDQALFKRMLKDQQRDHTYAAVNRAFAEWKKDNQGVIEKQVMAYLDKEMPRMVQEALPKLAKDFYFGFDN
jgi:cation transport regulator ChaB